MSNRNRRDEVKHIRGPTIKASPCVVLSLGRFIRSSCTCHIRFIIYIYLILEEIMFLHLISRLGPKTNLLPKRKSWIETSVHEHGLFRVQNSARDDVLPVLEAGEQTQGRFEARIDNRCTCTSLVNLIPRIDALDVDDADEHHERVPPTSLRISNAGTLHRMLRRLASRCMVVLSPMVERPVICKPAKIALDLVTSIRPRRPSQVVVWSPGLPVQSTRSLRAAGPVRSQAPSVPKMMG